MDKIYLIRRHDPVDYFPEGYSIEGYVKTEDKAIDTVRKLNKKYCRELELDDNGDIIDSNENQDIIDDNGNSHEPVWYDYKVVSKMERQL